MNGVEVSVPSFVREASLREIIGIDLGLEGDWSHTVETIWTPDAGFTGFGRTPRSHPALRPAIELKFRDGWIGVGCHIEEEGGYVLDENRAKRLVEYAAKRRAQEEIGSHGESLSILWRGTAVQSSEHCDIVRRRDGYGLSGVVVLPMASRPSHIMYTVDVDENWITRSVRVAATTGVGRQQHLALDSDGRGSWWIDGSRAPDIAGCVDVDLGFSPSTNTLPLRRLATGRTDYLQISAALVRFPEMQVERSEQTYQRISSSRWRFKSAGFEAGLVVDGASVVQTYGDDLWKVIAYNVVPDEERNF